MQEDYNGQYRNILKRLKLLKIKSQHNKTFLNDSDLYTIDKLLKELDWRYSEEKQLDSVDYDVESLESRLIYI